MLNQIMVLDSNEDFLTVLSNTLPDACPIASFRQIQEAQENGAYSDTCILMVPATHADATYLTVGNYIIFRDYDGYWQEYRIVIPERQDTQAGSYIVATCENAFYELNGDKIDDIRPTDKTAAQAIIQALDNTRWSIGTAADLGTNSTRIYRSSVLAGLVQIAGAWGGELRFRIEVSGGAITNRFVDILSQRGNNTGKRFEYTKDITSVIQTVNMQNLYTALTGRGKGIETDGGSDTEDPTYGRRLEFDEVEWATGDGDPADKPLGQNYIEDTTATAAYGPAGRPIHGFVTFDDCTDAEELLQLTYDALQLAKVPQMTYQMTAIALEELTGHDHESFRFGDTVAVINNAGQKVIQVPTPSEKSGESLSFERTYDDAFLALSVSAKADSTVQAVTTHGKNLLDKNRANIVSGYPSAGVIKSSTATKLIWIKCVPNTAYTVSKILSSRFTVFDAADVPNVGSSYISAVVNTSATQLTITTGATARYLGAYIYHSSFDTTITLQDILDSLQIELGSTATAYEPFVPNSPSPDYPAEWTSAGGCNLLVSDGATTDTYAIPALNGRGTVVDTYDVLTDTKVAKWVQAVLDETNTWDDANFAASGYFSTTITGIAAAEALCTHFKYAATPAADSNEFAISGNELRFYPDNLTATNKTAWLTWLAANPITVLYQLATPVTTTGTPQTVRTFAEQTNVTQDSAVKGLITAIANILKDALSPAIIGQARIIFLDRDYINPDYCQITIGNYVPSSARTIQATQSQLSSFSDRAAVWDRANAITENTSGEGTLEYTINLLKTEISSVTSHFYTDSNGNFIFENESQTAALKLGAGIFALANSKVGSDWDWRTFGTGNGFVADEIISGTLNSALIFAGTLMAASGTFTNLVAGATRAQRMELGYDANNDPYIKMYDNSNTLRLTILKNGVLFGSAGKLVTYATGNRTGVGVFV